MSTPDIIVTAMFLTFVVVIVGSWYGWKRISDTIMFMMALFLITYAPNRRRVHKGHIYHSGVILCDFCERGHHIHKPTGQCDAETWCMCGQEHKVIV